ncbi:MAG: transcription-repair coupling factor, partial [Alphaproteobacteria bacterium]|nr:transcription-repair coupling factor [Alphaproteobacteria bacterium]
TLTALLQPSPLPRLVLTTVAGLAQRLPLPEVFAASSLLLTPGATHPMPQLLAYLTGQGYHRTATVREAGEFAVRGGIVDLFPSGAAQPVRVDFFGDTVEQLRAFDPLTQITTGTVPQLALQPMAEIIFDDAARERFRTQYRALFGVVQGADPLYEAVSEGRIFPGMEHWLPLFYEKLGTLFDYVPQAWCSADWQAEEALTARQTQIDDFYQARQSLYAAEKKQKSATHTISYKPVPPEQLYLSPAALRLLQRERVTAQLSPFAAPIGAADIVECGARRGQDFAAARALAESGSLYRAVRDTLQQYSNRRAALACYSNGARERILGMAREHGVSFTPVDDFMALRKLPAGVMGAIILGLEHGFVSDDLIVVTEQDVLGERLIRKPRKHRASDPFRLELGALNLGDLVVHSEHGVGRYEGLETLRVADTPAHDCLKLIYDGGDKLYVPVENLDVLTRYSADGSGATLDKLGGLGWQTRKAKVKKRLKDMTEALLKIAAERATREGERIEALSGTYDEFCARFPYPETEDQAQAITDVAVDLASGKPMDRLVCGDVGFGKTEVALRAAFLAVQAGLQVAVVVPTTLLARQHTQNFNRRFAGFPFRIAQLSRFVSAKDAAETHTAMREGLVDIVIGTHALLAKDIAFKQLGLVIIDEEQHFGVKQKERLKQFRSEVHVLTLTATPIPRTLQLALAGVRELSLITTPPLDRLAVRTFVLPYDPLVVREAIMREHFRGGQVYYVCPRIEDLADVEAGLRDLVPEVKLVTAHGRLAAGTLDDIMTAFDAGQYDVLLATNIVESGLDIPNANTLIIHRADMFGLSQLYQLRGRVGRGKQRGYAYFTTPARQVLSEAAQKRLEVIQTLDQLGAGFQLASHDMDIRGSGNLLGEEQSGHIREVGIELYQQMLEDAVATARAGGTQAAPTDWTPQINLGVPVLIPETYVADLHVRLGLYRRIAELVDQEEIDAFAAELTDRFGRVPEEVENLLHTIAVKQICKQAQIARVDVGPKGAVLAFHNNSFARPEKLIAWLNQQSGTAKMRPDQRLVLVRAWDEPEARLRGLRQSLHQLAELAA